MDINAISGLCAVIILLVFLDRRLRRAKPGNLLILEFTHVGARPPRADKKLWIKPAALKKRLGLLAKKGYTFINARDYAQNKIPPKATLVTFNCGYEDFYLNALPVLTELKIPALVFLCVEGINGYDFWHKAPGEGPWHNMLTAAQIKELQESGLIDFGPTGLTGGAKETEKEIAEAVHRLKTLYKIEPLFYRAPQAGSQPGDATLKILQ